MPLSQEDIEEMYETEKTAAQEKFLQMVAKKDTDKDRAEAWLKGRLQSARKKYYRRIDSAMANERRQRKLLNTWKPVMKILKRFKDQFD